MKHKSVVKAKTTFSTVTTRPVTILVTEYQYETMRRMCVAFGEPGVPLSRMAATALSRGLVALSKEIKIETPTPADVQISLP